MKVDTLDMVIIGNFFVAFLEIDDLILVRPPLS
jgi:hypothetical protein